MEFIDTHTHLYCADFLTAEQPRHKKKGAPEVPPVPTPRGGEEAVERAIAAGVSHMIFPAISIPENAPMKALAAKFPGKITMAMGLHPSEIEADPKAELDIIEAEFRNNPGLYHAVGEIGIDLYWEQDRRQDQLYVFDRQCRLALDLDMPIIIHCRDGLNEVLDTLRALPAIPRGVFHSFGGTVEDVERIRALGDFYFGINGIVTFKNSGLPAVLPAIGIDRILLETDSPYLAPVPYRGRRNESSYLPATAQAVADALSVPLETVAETTTASARHLFNL